MELSNIKFGKQWKLGRGPEIFIFRGERLPYYKVIRKFSFSRGVVMLGAFNFPGGWCLKLRGLWILWWRKGELIDREGDHSGGMGSII